ncbi:hypothetical protein Pfo_014401 [Paulownia fortunei]|nr:hypothetical protein Pfo_014401 [Paulownia fortunei]
MKFIGMAAFLITWKKACQTNGGLLLIPPGTYLLSGAEFAGPCNRQTRVCVDGTLKASSDPTLNVDYWIMFQTLNSLAIYGNGTLDGNGASSWGHKCKDPSLCKSPPTSIKLNQVTNALIQDINSVNSKMFHMDIHDSQHVIVNNVHMSAPSKSTNTDGIHIGGSNDIRVTNAHIATGDDCISIGGGCTNINITGKDVSLITVSNSTLTNTDNGLRIKTWAPSPPSMASAITFQHIIMNNVNNPIIIDQHYCPDSSCTQQGGSNVEIKGVKFIDIRGSSATAVAVKIECSESKPCQHIQLSGLSLTFKGQPTTALCSYAYYKFLGSNQVPSKCSSPGKYILS